MSPRLTSKTGLVLNRWPISRFLTLLLSVESVFTVLVFPIGNFPLNDDWAYAHSVAWILSNHTFRLSDWIAMNLLPQTLMGWAATVIFGYSFTALRGVTQLVALLTSLIAFQFFRACGIDRRSSFLATLVVICLPWWQILANSYMTDIYGLLFALLAGYCLVRQLSTPRSAFFALGVIFSAIGMLQRQVTLVIPVAFLFAWLSSRDVRSWRNWVIALVPLLVTATAEHFYRMYLASGPGIPHAQQILHGRLLDMAMRVLLLEPGYPSWFAENLAEISGYIGLFLAVPATTLFFAESRGSVRLATWIAAAALFATCLMLGWLPPYRQNHVLDAAGIGPFTLGNGMQPSSHLYREKGLFWDIAGALASAGIVLLGIAIWKTAIRLRTLSRRRRAVLVFLSAVVVLYIIPFAVTDYFDRYLLFVFPFLLSWIFIVTKPADGASLRHSWLISGAGFTVAVGLIGALAVHDYFAWNRARWAAIHYAEQALGAGPPNMDGGFEYNGYYNFEMRKNLAPATGKHAWWWVVDDVYLVSFEEKEGYRPVRTFTVDAYLPRTPRFVRLLRRIE